MSNGDSRLVPDEYSDAKRPDVHIFLCSVDTLVSISIDNLLCRSNCMHE